MELKSAASRSEEQLVAARDDLSLSLVYHDPSFARGRNLL